MTHREMLRDIARVRAVLQKRMNTAFVNEDRGEKALQDAIAAFQRVHAMATARGGNVASARHQGLLSTIDKRQSELLKLREERRQVEDEHRAYFVALQSGSR